MKILKKLAATAVFGAIALPFAGAATFVGVQAASAGTPLLTCTSVAPASGIDGGLTFDTNSDGSSPGSTGIYFNSSPGGSMELENHTAPIGTTYLELEDPVGSTALATTGETIQIGGTNYTVTSDSFPALPNSKGQHSPEYVLIAAPGLTAAGAKGESVTVLPTTTSSFRTVSDAVFNGTATMTSATADFTNADVGVPVSGEVGGNSIGTGAPTTPPAQPLTIAAVNSTTSVTLSATPQVETSAGPPATYGNASGTGGVITIGNTDELSNTIYGDMDLAATGCESSANAVGEFAPTYANLSGPSAGIPNTAIALESTPANLDLNVTYPPIGSGWADNGGSGATQPTTSIQFDGKNAFVLAAPANAPSGACGANSVNCDSYTKGAVAGDFVTTTKGNLGLAADGMIFCTDAEAQAIAGTPDNGGPDNTHNGGTITTGASPLSVCDGASGNHANNGGTADTTESGALQVIITLELNPQASAYGSDNTSPTSIWNIQADNASNAVW